jgi:hypothetical protein
MTVALPFLAGVLLGFILRRWAALVLAPAAGVLVLAIAFLTRGQITDTPAIFVTISVAAGIILGVFARGRRVEAAS